MQSFLTDREDVEDRQVLKFINPVADSDDEGDIFEPERSFFVFLSLHAFPEIPEMLGAHAVNKFNF